MSRLITGLIVLVSLTWAAELRAAHQKVSADGTVHSVSVETWSQPGGTAIKHTRQQPDGTQESFYIPGTDDVALDWEPALDIDPSSGGPIVVWTRNEGDGFDLLVSKYVDGEWSDPRVLFSGGPDKSKPEIQIFPKWAHLMWREVSPGGTKFFRAVLDPLTLEPVHGPEPLSTSDDTGLVSPEGEPEAGLSPEPLSDRLYLAGDVISLNPGDPGKVFCWGVRDEPIPIDYLQGFLLPTDLRDVQHPQTHWLSGRFTLSYHDSEHFYYTMRKDNRWTDLRTITLDDQTSPADALLQVEEMIRKDR